METTSLVDIMSVILSVLNFSIALLKAIVLPVAPAAVLIAFLVDHVFKRFSFWKDGWGGKASLGLNMLFSAGLFFMSLAGQSAAYLEVVSQLGVVATLILAAASGFLVSAKTHTVAVERGVGKSTTGEAVEKEAEALKAVGEANLEFDKAVAASIAVQPSLGDGPIGG